MVKYHLKRFAMPKTWLIKRKNIKFSLRPSGSGYPFNLGIPITYAFRDLLGVADNVREVKYLLHSKDVLVDGRRIKDHKFLVGLFSVISIPKNDVYYRVVLTDKQRLDVVAIDKKEADLKLKKIIGKTILKGSKQQINFNDGTNLLSQESYKVGDSVLFDISKKSVKEHYSLKEGSFVAMLSGRHAGSQGTIEKLQDKLVFIKIHDKVYETIRRNLFILGDSDCKITSTKVFEDK